MAWMYGQREDVKINISEDVRPQCMYKLRFRLTAHEKLSINDVINRVKEKVKSKLDALHEKMYREGLSPGDYSIDVAVTSYAIEELEEYNYVYTIVEGIVVVELHPPFGQYALIVAEREGY